MVSIDEYGDEGFFLDFNHPEGKLVYQEYSDRLVKEDAKLLSYKEWRREIPKEVTKVETCSGIEVIKDKPTEVKLRGSWPSSRFATEGGE